MFSALSRRHIYRYIYHVEINVYVSYDKKLNKKVLVDVVASGETVYTPAHLDFQILQKRNVR